jgi:hypothetical protein
MVLSDLIKVPIVVSLSVIALILVVSVVASILFPRRVESGEVAGKNESASNVEEAESRHSN